MSDGSRCNGDKPGRQGALRVRRGHAVKTRCSGMVSMRTGSSSGMEGAVGGSAGSGSREARPVHRARGR